MKIPNIYTYPLLLLMAVLLDFDALSASAQDKISAKDFDKNGNNLIDEGPEQTRLILFKEQPSIIQLDRDANGEVTTEEIEEAIQDPSFNNLGDLNSTLNLWRDQQGGRLTLTFINEKLFPKPGKEPITTGFNGFRLRKDLDDSNLVDTINNKDSFAQSDPALLSFSQDFENDTSTIAARAALYYPIRVETGKEVEDSPVLTAYQVSPGIAVDFVEEIGNDEGDESSLTLAVNSDFEVQGLPIFRSQYFRGKLLYETGAEFDRSTISGKFEWEPVNTKLGLGARVKKLFGLPIDMRWRGMINTEIGTVLTAGDLDDVNNGDFFFRVGPKIEVEFFPNTNSSFLDRFGLQADYSLSQKITGDLDTLELFETALFFRLDDTGNANFQANYRVGDIGLTGQDVEELFFGFSFKF